MPSVLFEWYCNDSKMAITALQFLVFVFSKHLVMVLLTSDDLEY